MYYFLPMVNVHNLQQSLKTKIQRQVASESPWQENLTSQEIFFACKSSTTEKVISQLLDSKYN